MHGLNRVAGSTRRTAWVLVVVLLLAGGTLPAYADGRTPIYGSSAGGACAIASGSCTAFSGAPGAPSGASPLAASGLGAGGGAAAHPADCPVAHTFHYVVDM